MVSRIALGTALTLSVAAAPGAAASLRVPVRAPAAGSVAVGEFSVKVGKHRGKLVPPKLKLVGHHGSTSNLIIAGGVARKKGSRKFVVRIVMIHRRAARHRTVALAADTTLSFRATADEVLDFEHRFRANYVRHGGGRANKPFCHDAADEAAMHDGARFFLGAPLAGGVGGPDLLGLGHILACTPASPNLFPLFALAGGQTFTTGTGGPLVRLPGDLEIPLFHPGAVAAGTVDLGGPGEDLVIVEQGFGLIFVVLNPTTGSPQVAGTLKVDDLFSHPNLIPTSVTGFRDALTGLTDIAITDIGSPTGRSGAGQIIVGINDGSGTFADMFQFRQFVATPGATNLVNGDFNNDGIDDLAYVDFGANFAAVALNDGSNAFLTPQVRETGGFVPVSVQIADVNDDNDLDLVVLNRGGTAPGNQSIVSVLDGAGDGRLIPTGSLLNVPNFALSLTGGLADFQANGVRRVVDFNHDGFPDLAVTSSRGGSSPSFNPSATLLLNRPDSPGNFNAQPPILLFDDSGLGAFNGLSVEDTIGGPGVVSGRCGDPIFGSRSGIGSGGANFVMNVADFNADGSPDLVVSGSGFAGALTSTPSSTSFRSAIYLMGNEACGVFRASHPVRSGFVQSSLLFLAPPLTPGDGLHLTTFALPGSTVALPTGGGNTTGPGGNTTGPGGNTTGPGGSTTPLSVKLNGSSTGGQTYFVPSTTGQIQFMAEPAGGNPPYSYDWDFGDGSAHSSQQSVDHTFPETTDLETGRKQYTTKITVSDQSGATASLSLTVIVQCGTEAKVVTADIGSGSASNVRLCGFWAPATWGGKSLGYVTYEPGPGESWQFDGAFILYECLDPDGTPQSPPPLKCFQPKQPSDNDGHFGAIFGTNPPAHSGMKIRVVAHAADGTVLETRDFTIP